MAAPCQPFAAPIIHTGPNIINTPPRAPCHPLTKAPGYWVLGTAAPHNADAEPIAAEQAPITLKHDVSITNTCDMSPDCSSEHSARKHPLLFQRSPFRQRPALSQRATQSPCASVGQSQTPHRSQPGSTSRHPAVASHQRPRRVPVFAPRREPGHDGTCTRISPESPPPAPQPFPQRRSLCPDPSSGR